MLKIIKLAWRNIGRNRRRTAITAVTITVAITYENFLLDNRPITTQKST